MDKEDTRVAARQEKIECDIAPGPDEYGRYAQSQARQYPETKHSRDCAYVTNDGPAPCTCPAGEYQLNPEARQGDE